MLDTIAVHEDFIIAMDSAIKGIVPGRAPCEDRASARRYLSDLYAALIVDLAEHYGVSKSAIRRAGPGVASFHASIPSIFRGK